VDENLTVVELITLLEDCDPDAQVRLAHQPAWPLQFTLAGIATTDDLRKAHANPTIPGTGPDTNDRTEDGTGRDGQAVVWLVPGDPPAGATPYAPEQLWEHARRD
jgi:hypothetical protein